MEIPRKNQIDSENSGYYHLISRSDRHELRKIFASAKSAYMPSVAINIADSGLNNELLSWPIFSLFKCIHMLWCITTSWFRSSLMVITIPVLSEPLKAFKRKPEFLSSVGLKALRILSGSSYLPLNLHSFFYRQSLDSSTRPVCNSKNFNKQLLLSLKLTNPFWNPFKNSTEQFELDEVRSDFNYTCLVIFYSVFV